MNRVFEALADPTRRKILSMLAKRDLSAGEIADAFEITKPSVSHHLALLRGADLIESRRAGQSLIYTIHTTVLEDTLAGFLDLIQKGKPAGKRGGRRKS